MRDGLDALRDQLGEVMADLRLHITDLRVAERPGTGWAVLSAAVQSFGSVTGMRTTVTVSERQRRLDPASRSSCTGSSWTCSPTRRRAAPATPGDSDRHRSSARPTSRCPTTATRGPLVRPTAIGRRRRRTSRGPFGHPGRTTVTLTVEESAPVAAAARRTS